MTRQDIFEYAKEKHGTTPDYPWDNLPNYAVLRHKDSDKWYGLIMDVEKSKLNLEGNKTIDIIDMKCDPIMVGSLRKEKGFLPAYHMSKEHWVTAQLDSPAEDKIFQLLDESYELTKK